MSWALAARAAIIEVLIGRKFLQRKKRQLISTETGRALIDAVAPEVANPATTALWEQALDDIAGGKMEMGHFLERQTAWVSSTV